MSAIELGAGIILEGADEQSVQTSLSRRRRSFAQAFVGDDLSSDIDAALSEADFSIDADAIIEPPSPAPARRGITEAEPEQSPELKVTVEDGQSAVLLVENADGVFHWQYPDEDGKFGPDRRGAPAKTLNFTLSRPEHSESVRGRRGIGDVMGWVGNKLIEPIRVRVLRFFAEKTIDAAVAKIEGDLVPGLVWLNGSSDQWEIIQNLPPLPIGRPPRVLLLVHGTFSTTLGSFAALEASGVPKGHFLSAARSEYDLVLGFDHKTLALDPKQNAQQILDALNFLPDGTVIDAIAFSRGGLVFRSLAERLAKETNSGLQFRKTVFVGCTNSGTNLAEPDNWDDLVGLYTNIGLGGARALSILGSPVAGRIAREAIKIMGGFVQALPELAIEDGKVPGLAAMEPDGEFVLELNEGTSPLGRYFAIVSDFEPRPVHERGLSAGLAGFLADRLMDRLQQEANDLVVNTASMTRFGADEEIHASQLRRFDPDDAVYHTVYFQARPVSDWLAEWLLPPIEAEFEEHAAADGDGDIDFIPGPAPAPRPAMAPPPRTTRGGRRSMSDVFPGAGYADGGSVGDADGDPAPPDGSAFEEALEEAFEETTAPDEALISIDEPAEAAPDTKPAETVPCHFAAEMFPTPKVGVTPLIVTISRQKLQVADHLAAGTTSEPAEADPFKDIDVMIMAMDNCRVWTDGPGVHEDETGTSAQAKVPVPNGTEVLRFVVEGVDLGVARVQVEISQGPHGLASFTLEPVFIDPEMQRLTAEQVARPMVPSEKYPAVLKIFEQHVPGVGLVIKYDLASKDPSIAAMEEVTLPSSFSIEAFSKELLDAFDEAYNLGSQEYDNALANFSSASVNRTNELLPEGIRKALWENWDGIEAIQVFAENAYLPWELLSIEDPSGAPPPPGMTAFLAERGLIRWVYNAPMPRAELPIRQGKARHVIPDYLHAGHRLKYSTRERGLIESLFSGASSAGDTSKDVTDFLYNDARDCDVLHFTCHGDTAHKAVLSADLFMKGFDEGGGIKFDRLSADIAKRYSRFNSKDGPSTLVFVNACKTGQTGGSIAGVSGFAESFLRPNSREGAAAFIGALWSVDDQYAYSFAETFYEAMMNDGLTLIEATKKARESSKAGKNGEKDFTWLAYTVYGNPMARFVEV